MINFQKLTVFALLRRRFEKIHFVLLRKLFTDPQRDFTVVAVCFIAD